MERCDCRRLKVSGEARAGPTGAKVAAMAGVPKLKWRTSLDKCSTKPCSYTVGYNAAHYYRKMYGIPDKAK